MKLDIKGIIPAMITPLNDDETVNKEELCKVVNYLIEGGVHGLFIVGSSGEWYGLSNKQKEIVIKTVMEEVDGRTPIYVGTGLTTTEQTVEMSKMAEEAGADALSVLTPVFINPGDDELYTHYKTVAENVNIPVLLYNNPGRTGINLSVELVKKLSLIDNIVGVKDSSGNMTLTAEYIRTTDKDFKVLAGRDTLILSTLVYGGVGSISATANVFPEIPVSIYEDYVKGDLESALKSQFELAPLRMAFKLGTFPSVLKESLNIIGFNVGETMKPVGPLTEETKNKLKAVIDEMKNNQ